MRRGVGARELVEALQADVAAFAAGAEAADDLTILALRWNGPAGAGPVMAGLADQDLDAPVARLGHAVGGGHDRLALAAADDDDVVGRDAARHQRACAPPRRAGATAGR